MINAEDLRRFINADASVSDQSLSDAIAVAQELVNQRVGSSPVPGTVIDFCVREVAGNVYKRQEDSSGIRGYNSDGAAVFVARDVMYSVAPMLNRWLLPF